MTAWKVAEDIGKRIEELRVALDITQSALADRANVHAPQVSNWIQGKQRPSKKRLEWWAKRENWSVDMFAEGGRRPKEVVNRPVNASTVREPHSPRYDPGRLFHTAETTKRLDLTRRLHARVLGMGTVSKEDALGLVNEMSDAWALAEAMRSGGEGQVGDQQAG